VVYGNQVKIGQFLTSLAQGFVQTRIEILLLISFLIALLVVFSVYLAVQKHGADRQAALHSQEMLHHLVAKLTLDGNERELLGVLATHLDKGVPEYVLLVSRHVFDACAQKSLQAADATDVQINALRLKIGFRLTKPGEVPSSSAELPEGSIVLLQWLPQKRARARVVAQGPGAMTVQLEAGTISLAPGTSVRLSFYNSAGIFSMATRVTEHAGNTVSLEQSSSMVRLQRRKYYRRREELPVLVKSISSTAAESILLDLGGGGASLQNPRRMMSEGDRIELSFSPRIGNLTIPARVIRMSKDRKVIHVEFESPSEKQRDRIMGFLFRPNQQRAEGALSGRHD
jgi:PilZ domain